jgi:hypothetical protein
MLERLETAKGVHPRTKATKNVIKSHEPVVNVDDLVANALREYQSAGAKN